ncbi:hypothetical protein D3C85_969300 [compost metagenome]
MRTPSFGFHMPRGRELKKSWMLSRSDSGLVAVYRKKSSRCVAAFGSSMPTKTPDSISMSRQRVPSMGTLKAMAKVSWKFQTGRQDGRRAAPSPTPIGCRSLQPRRFPWRSIWLSRKVSAPLMPPLRIRCLSMRSTSIKTHFGQRSSC